MFTLLKLILSLFKLGFTLITWLIEALLWCLYFLKQVILKIFDAGRSVHSIRDGVLRCPKGHEIPTHGGVYECSECGWVSESPMYACPNPECGAITPYINCPTCGLSVRNPYRVGRP